ncbi:MAG: hypothetical protein ACI8VC_000776 [Candidatus Endobugula sp.]
MKRISRAAFGKYICSCNICIPFLHIGQGRFKSQPLLTEEALFTAMTYVDINSIRAKMANTPEQSKHTSIKQRIAPSFSWARALEGSIKHDNQSGDYPATTITLAYRYNRPYPTPRQAWVYT